MKGFMIALLVLTSSAAFAKDVKPIDVDCNKMATNARGFAELKQGGIATTPDQLTKFVVAPSVASYPIKSVLEYVLNAPDPAPELVYNSLYNKCTMMGYKELFTYFTEREEVAGYKIQISDQLATIASLQKEVNNLTQQVMTAQYPTTTTTRRNGKIVVEKNVVTQTASASPQPKAYGAPINEPIVRR